MTKTKVKMKMCLRAASFSKRMMLFALLLLPVSMFAQNINVSGIVSDQNNEPVIGASIVVKGASGVGTVTNVDGNYSISVKPDDVLIYSYIGMISQEIAVDGRTSINVILRSDDVELEAVVVVGYGSQKKKLVTGATTQVRGDDIKKLSTVNVLGAMQSQTPGVSIIKNDGLPGAGYKVNIRGLGTTGNSTPLYIVDGMQMGDINSINPSDIESIDVLKDAASAAIYGAKAANGVILVTTKHGKVGKPQITFDSYYGVQNVYRMPQMLNAQQYIAIMEEARLNDGNTTPWNFEALIPDYAKIKDGSWKGTNWMEEARVKNAPIQDYAIGITGGTEQSIYALSFSYTSQDAVFGRNAAPKYNRFTARTNTEYTLIKKGNLDIVKFGENISYSRTGNSGSFANGDIWYNDMRPLLARFPVLPMTNSKGDTHFAIDWDNRQGNPVVGLEKRAENESKGHALNANMYLTIQPIKNLILKSSYNYSMWAGASHSFAPLHHLSTTDVSAGVEVVSQSMYEGSSMTWENTANYNFTLKGVHNISTLVGQSIEMSGNSADLSATNANPIFHDLLHAYIGNTPTIADGNIERAAMSGLPGGQGRFASVFGRVNYDYANKYMATVVMRADGSSNFAPGHRWGYFPSVSAGWVISEEQFLNSTRGVIDFLKLRASWGQNGNHAIPNYQYLSTIASNASYAFGNDKNVTAPGSYPDILPNENITWETSEQLDLGFDARLINSRLSLAFDYYIKTTRDWLVDAPQLASYGTGAPYINGGDVENKGVELGLGWTDHIGEFQYGANVSFAYNKNVVTKLANSEGVIHGDGDALFTNCGESYRAQVGLPAGFFYGYQSAGIFQSQDEVDNYRGAKLAGTQEGDVIWVDRNKDGVIDEKDMGMIGDPHPDVNLGVGLNAAYKGFDFSVALTGAFGHQIYQSLRGWSDLPTDNFTTDIFDRWHGAGTSNRYPRLTYTVHTNRRFVSDLYVQDGDYMRIQNVTLGYDFKRLLPNVSIIGQARVYVSVQNLYTFTNYTGMDPEVGFGHNKSWMSGIDVGYFPSPRTCIFGVNFKF
ncbi:MAG: TonB-dependent receptor [Cytophagaceae bacterium]|nr:TonB-dependent receptor [Cytophagaceae bacterium]